MAKKIAFIRYRSFSHINDSVQTQLSRVFPQNELQVIDVADLLAAHKGVLLWNQAHIFKTYGADILAKRRYCSECLFRTRYIFRRVNELIRARLAGGDYLFTFQTQSLFDGSLPGVPHFLYTDHTNRANLYYDGFGDSKVFPEHWYQLERTIYERTERVFTMSTHVSRSLVEQYHLPAQKVVNVYVGSNTTVTNSFDTARYRSKRILFVGVHWERKGGPQLAEAFRTVLKSHPDAKLTIVGCSPTLDLPNCEIVGKIPLEKVRAYYAESAIFCLPTRLEPFGIVFVEAMLHQLPIVSTRIGALPDFVEDGKNGYLVPSGDTVELAERLTQLLDHPEKCESFGRAGRQVAEERYSWDAVGDRLENAIKEVVV